MKSRRGLAGSAEHIRRVCDKVDQSCAAACDDSPAIARQLGTLDHLVQATEGLIIDLEKRLKPALRPEVHQESASMCGQVEARSECPLAETLRGVCDRLSVVNARVTDLERRVEL